jgi:hypothetical protein
LLLLAILLLEATTNSTGLEVDLKNDLMKDIEELLFVAVSILCCLDADMVHESQKENRQNISLGMHKCIDVKMRVFRLP